MVTSCLSDVRFVIRVESGEVRGVSARFCLQKAFNSFFSLSPSLFFFVVQLLRVPSWSFPCKLPANTAELDAQSHGDILSCVATARGSAKTKFLKLLFGGLY